MTIGLQTRKGEKKGKTAYINMKSQKELDYDELLLCLEGFLYFFTNQMDQYTSKHALCKQFPLPLKKTME